MAGSGKRPASLTSYLVRRRGRCKGGQKLKKRGLSLEQRIGRGTVAGNRFLVGADPRDFCLKGDEAGIQLVHAQGVEILARKQRQRFLGA